MATNAKPVYIQTKGKIRTLWEIASKLVAQYEEFDRRLTELENKVSTLNSRVDSTIAGIDRNV
jgi:hypothetical protein